MRRISMAIMAGLVAAGLVAAPALALTRVVIEERSVAPLLFGGLDACLADYGFTYTGDYTRTRTITHYLDAGGNLVREVWAIHFDGSETNDADPTKSLVVNGERRLVFDYVANTFSETGTLRHVTAQGDGVVLLQVGKSVAPLEGGAAFFEAGPHQLNAGEVAAFCTALS
jgi:hypothetical protein